MPIVQCLNICIWLFKSFLSGFKQTNNVYSKSVIYKRLEDQLLTPNSMKQCVNWCEQMLNHILMSITLRQTIYLGCDFYQLADECSWMFD